MSAVHIALAVVCLALLGLLFVALRMGRVR